MRTPPGRFERFIGQRLEGSTVRLLLPLAQPHARPKTAILVDEHHASGF
jgi:hypothetical protein